MPIFVEIFTIFEKSKSIMKKNLYLLLGALAVVCGLTSCSTTAENDFVTKQGINKCFTLYTDATTGASSAGAETGYSIVINYTKETCDISITGLAIPNGKAYPAIELTNLPCKVSNNELLTISALNVQSTISGFSSAPVFNSVKCQLAHRTIDNNYMPSFLIQFSVDGYNITSSLPDVYMLGRTVSTGPDNAAFTTDETKYQITLNSSLDKATIALSGAQFIGAMPALDITFPDVPVTVTDGKILLAAQTLTPNMKDTPAPGFPITNLKGSINPVGESSIEFDCAPQTMPGVFHVVATIDPTGAASSK